MVEDAIGTIAEAMIMSQFAMGAFIIGGVLLLSLLLPFGQFRRARMIGGFLFIAGGILLIVWFNSTLTGA